MPRLPQQRGRTQRGPSAEPPSAQGAKPAEFRRLGQNAVISTGRVTSGLRPLLLLLLLLIILLLFAVCISPPAAFLAVGITRARTPPAVPPAPDTASPCTTETVSWRQSRPAGGEISPWLKEQSSNSQRTGKVRFRCPPVVLKCRNVACRYQSQIPVFSG